MELRVLCQCKKDPPQLNVTHPIIDLTSNMVMTVAVVEGGMQSGDPSVLIVSEDREGTVLLQTSLDKFLAAASSMTALAESRFGWKQQPGLFTMMPPDKETRKVLLENIKKELEEWED